MAVVTWDDIVHVAERIFHVWSGGRELEWGHMAWQALERRGLTAYEDQVQYCCVLVRFMVICTIYREFCGMAWDEWDEPNLVEWADDLEVSAVRVGQLVGSDLDPQTGSDEVLDEALQIMVEEFRPSVFTALNEEFGGDSMLFASLWATNWGPYEDYDDYYDDEDDDDDGDGDPKDEEEVVDPGLKQLLEDPAVLDDILNCISAEKMRAYEWVVAGMPSVFP